MIAKLQELDYKYTRALAEVVPLESSFRWVIRIFTLSGTFIFWAIALVFYFIFQPHEYMKILAIILVMLAQVIFTHGTKYIVKRQRPHFGDFKGGVIKYDKYSFPSGHASRATYALMLMPLLFPGTFWFWLFWSLSIYASRLLLGVHYVSDILGGIVITAVAMYVLYYPLYAYDFISGIPF